MITCPNCGEENPAKFRLCGYCGTALVAAAPPQELRKLVSILFCDLKGSTNLGEALDPESLREVMARYFDVMSAAITRHGGTIEKYIGDAVMAVFGLPRVHEDDALRAVRAAQAMQDGLRSLNAGLEQRYGVTLANRIGVNTGEVVAGDAATQQRLVTGDAVNVAARLEQAAGDTETLIGELTYRLVRGVVEVEAVEPLTLKGKSEPVPAYRLVSIGDAFANEPLAQRQVLVGRSGEIAQVLSVLDEAVTSGTGRSVLVLGEAGVGKTRLLDELVGSFGAARVLRGRCLSYGEGITFWPLIEALRAASLAEDGDSNATAVAKLRTFVGAGHTDVVDRLSALMGLSDLPIPLTELFWGFRRMLELLADRSPVVLVIEDLHWAEPTLHDLLETIPNMDAPVLAVAAARPDVLERRPSLTGSRIVNLERLTHAETAEMVQTLLGSPLAEEGLAQIVAAADGNPLYAQQLVAVLQEDGSLQLDAGRWRLAGLPAGWVPPTIYALLSARIDNLEREDRAVLDPASVIGHVFPLAAVAELSEDFVHGQVEQRVERLTGLQYLQPSTDRSTEEKFHQFHHIFIRDSVYETLLKRQRATLHERFVEWADAVNGDRAIEFEEILGYHLEQAHRFLLELAPSDDHAEALGRDGSRRLSSAGRRAFVRGDMPAAATLLRRARFLLPDADLGRLTVAPDLAEALMQVGEFGEAAEVVESAQRQAEAIGEPGRAGGARVVGELVRLFSGETEGWSETARTTANDVIATAGEVDDHVTLARAFRLLAWVDGTACRYESAAAALGKAIEHARLGNDIRQERRASTAYALTSAYGPTPVGEALERCARVAERVAGDRQAEAAVLCVAAHLEAMRGEFDLARELCAASRRLFEELGLRVEAASVVLESARVELLAGNAADAERELTRGFRVLEELRERYVLSTLAGLLARALWLQGRADEAEDHTTLAEELADPDDVDAQVNWRSVQAQILAARGEGDAAEELARGAVELLEPTDATILQIQALVDLADTLDCLGRPGADEARRRAHDLAVAKQSDVLVQRVIVRV
ncbi:MAG: AAA family ATPase [Gaiellaceae bacterium]